ncbi:hypothetical protein G9A89_017582 [Geosiphon pyriformis]|nr:hypothetical protein G9A89_017582 [Geosiphon pyriformis]
MVSQLSSGCQPLVIPSSQNQGVDIVISENLSVATTGKTVAGAVVFDNSVIGKIKDTLKNLAIMVIGLSAKMDNTELVWRFATCNVQGINVPTKQVDVVCWHKESENMISFITETKLRPGIRS